MYTFLMIFSVIISGILIVAVLLQSSKGGGLAGSFGGTGTFGTVFGTRRTADFLSKTTWWLGGILITLSLVINLFFLKGSASGTRSIIQESGRPVSSSVPQTQTQAPQSAPVQQQK